MFIRIEAGSGVPITRQIMDQVRDQCASGALSPGDRLPSVRQLARELAVNQNTILRVYERLTMEGLLERRHGAGTYVVDKLVPGYLKAQRQQLSEEAERLVRRSVTLGLGPDEVDQLVKAAFARVKRGPRPDSGKKE